MQSFRNTSGKNTLKTEWFSCYTCGKRMEWTEIQCGHFVSRTYLATRFSEENCKPQCVGCNVFGGGRTAIFAIRLEKEKTGTVNNLYKQSQHIVKNYPYEEKIKYYQEKLKQYESI